MLGKQTRIVGILMLLTLGFVEVNAQDTSQGTAPTSQAPTAPAQAPTAPGQAPSQTPYGQQAPNGQQQPLGQQQPNDQQANQDASDQFTLSMPGSGTCTYNQQGILVTSSRFGEQPPQNSENCPTSVDTSQLQFMRRRRRGQRLSSDMQGQAQGQSQGAPNSFQVFVKESLGHDLPMFGYDLFEQPPSTFAPVDNVAVPEDYVIGPGDEINIRIWGALDEESKQTVDRSGSIFLPKVGPVVVAGLRASQLSQSIRQSLSRMFKNFDVTATVGQLRSVQVMVVGFARRPGVYTVSSLSTLVNAIFASGGPSFSGSMRKIELRRSGKMVQTIDLYDLLIHGDSSHDAKLQPGDIIFFPPIGKLVAIPDEVKVPAIYELSGSSTIKDAIAEAGGFTTTAYIHELTVESIANSKDRKVERFPLDEAAMQRKVSDGDLLLLGPISPRFENAVMLRGNVARSGRYPYTEGMRIHDIIPSWQSLISPEYWHRLNTSSSKISEFGIRNDVRFERVDINWDYALIQRIDTQKLTSVLLTFNLGKAILDKDPEEDKVLLPGDIVTIFSQADLRVPVSKRAKFVTLEGEFKAAGVYRLLPEETLPQLINRVGGFTADAYLPALELKREAVLQKQKKNLDEFVNRMQSDIEQVALNTQGTDQTSSDTRARLQTQRQLLARLRQAEPTGRIALNIVDNQDAVLPPVVLDDGDTIMAPTRPVTVSVVGMVYNSGDFVYNRRTRLHEYVKYAGGLTRGADKSKLYILGVNGDARLVSGSVFRGDPAGAVRPGDTIIVPEQPNPGQFMRDLKDWTAILAQFGISAAAVKVLSQ